MNTIYRQEKDAIVFLGLMAIAFKKLNKQFKHRDGELTHHYGLNIFAASLICILFYMEKFKTNHANYLWKLNLKPRGQNPDSLLGYQLLLNLSILSKNHHQ